MPDSHKRRDDRLICLLSRLDLQLILLQVYAGRTFTNILRNLFQSDVQCLRNLVYSDGVVQHLVLVEQSHCLLVVQLVYALVQGRNELGPADLGQQALVDDRNHVDIGVGQTVEEPGSKHLKVIQSGRYVKRTVQISSLLRAHHSVVYLVEENRLQLGSGHCVVVQQRREVLQEAGVVGLVEGGELEDRGERGGLVLEVDRREASAVDPLVPVDFSKLELLVLESKEIPHVDEEVLGGYALELVAQQVDSCELLHDLLADEPLYVGEELVALVVGDDGVGVVGVLVLEPGVECGVGVVEAELEERVVEVLLEEVGCYVIELLSVDLPVDLVLEEHCVPLVQPKAAPVPAGHQVPRPAVRHLVDRHVHVRVVAHDYARAREGYLGVLHASQRKARRKNYYAVLAPRILHIHVLLQFLQVDRQVHQFLDTTLDLARLRDQVNSLIQVDHFQSASNQSEKIGGDGDRLVEGLVSVGRTLQIVSQVSTGEGSNAWLSVDCGQEGRLDCRGVLTRKNGPSVDSLALCVHEGTDLVRCLLFTRPADGGHCWICVGSLTIDSDSQVLEEGRVVFGESDVEIPSEVSMLLGVVLGEVEGSLFVLLDAFDEPD